MTPSLATLAALALAVAPPLALATRPDPASRNGGWDQLHVVNKRWQLYTTVNEPGTTTTSTEAAPAATASVYSFAALTSPDVPVDFSTALTVGVPETADALVASGFALSVPQPGNFLGYSIELSVANQVCACSPPLPLARLVPASSTRTPPPFPPAFLDWPRASSSWTARSRLAWVCYPLSSLLTICARPMSCLLWYPQWVRARSSCGRPSSTTCRTCARGRRWDLASASAATRRRAASCTRPTSCRTEALEGASLSSPAPLARARRSAAWPAQVSRPELWS